MINVQKIGDWSIAIDDEPFGGWFTAWAKMGPILGDSPISEPGNYVWCQSAKTKEEAVRKLRQELAI